MKSKSWKSIFAVNFRSLLVSNSQLQVDMSVQTVYSYRVSSHYDYNFQIVNCEWTQTPVPRKAHSHLHFLPTVSYYFALVIYSSLGNYTRLPFNTPAWWIFGSLWEIQPNVLHFFYRSQNSCRCLFASFSKPTSWVFLEVMVGKYAGYFCLNNVLVLKFGCSPRILKFMKNYS